MDAPPLGWTIITRDDRDKAEPNPPPATLSDSLASDLFRDKFMGVAREGSHGEKIMRGFLIGVAIGLIVACFFCCWYPCCRTTRIRNNSRPRRRPLWRRHRDAPPTVEEGREEVQEVRPEAAVTETTTPPTATPATALPAESPPLISTSPTMTPTTVSTAVPPIEPTTTAPPIEPATTAPTTTPVTVPTTTPPAAPSSSLL